MSTRLFRRFIPMGGTSRRYWDKEICQSISRRDFLKLQGIDPEKRARERRAQGLIPRRKQRKDAKKPPSLVWEEAKKVPYVGRNAQVVPYKLAHSQTLIARRFAVFIDFVHAIDAYLIKPRKRRCSAWRCGCGVVFDNTKRLIPHVATHHLHGAGAALIPYPGEVHSHERKARLPWRVHSDDPRYK
jgi:hypothetical protein